MLADLRLFQLISPALPVGAFTYSQGLEWAIEAGWVVDADSLADWLDSVMQHSVMSLELPILIRLHRGFSALHLVNKASEAEATKQMIRDWCQYLIASRESAELRAEERQRGKALAVLLPSLAIDLPPDIADAIRQTQLAGMALAAVRWGIAEEALCRGYLWSWLENSVMAGVKLVPLGQTAGQQLLLKLSEKAPQMVEQALSLPDALVGSSTPALAIASSRHETQYTRLFRS
ncbi:urease accessory protein UreF [Nitrincola sp. MINF-07-Sa-05]|uniref:urease accessory protein UreF n=1 Tax=Nitrincola salilacus TaxID=3400273 RepID=UPI0039184F9C